MNAQDRSMIARLLDGISHDDTINVVNAGTWLMEHHPKIITEMQNSAWWGTSLAPEPPDDYAQTE